MISVRNCDLTDLTSAYYSVNLKYWTEVVNCYYLKMKTHC